MPPPPPRPRRRSTAAAGGRLLEAAWGPSRALCKHQQLCRAGAGGLKGVVLHEACSALDSAVSRQDGGALLADSSSLWCGISCDRACTCRLESARSSGAAAT